MKISLLMHVMESLFLLHPLTPLKTDITVVSLQTIQAQDT